ncbi:MAG: prenyltransferase [Pirellulales bacterium]|nr:prenyltransferase [Pirellulales bacterium]
MTILRRQLPFLAVIAVFLCLATTCPATSSTPEQTAGELITPETQQAIDRALVELASRQQENGSFGAAHLQGNVAITALAGMALMAGGSTPDRGPYGQNVTRALDYILAHSQPSGYIIAEGTTSQGPMYGHGFATLFLAECYGMSPNPKLREKLSLAVNLIVTSQNKEGGWRYYPNSTDADLSVTICQIMALRAARNAGIHVPKKTIDRCTQYVKNCQNPDGGFRYQIPPSNSRFPISAAGVVALYSAGIYEGPEITRGLAYVMAHIPGSKAGETVKDLFPFYGQYYAAIALWQAGGADWPRWYTAARNYLLAERMKDGTWFSNYTTDYATAMALIVLEMPNNYLPIFQR